MPLITREIDLEALSAELTIGGETPGKIAFSLADFPPAIVQQAALTGLCRKLTEATITVKASLARERNTSTSSISNTDPEYIARLQAHMRHTLEQLRSGTWYATNPEPSHKPKPKTNELALALSRLKQIPPQEALELVRRLASENPAKLQRWRQHPEVKLAIAQIRQERAEKRIQLSLHFEPFDLA